MKKSFFLLLFITLALLVNGQNITPSPLLASKTDTLGVAILTDKTPVLVGETIDKIDKIRSIKRRKNEYKMKPLNPPSFKLNGFFVDYHGALMLSEIGRMPDLKLQNTTNPANFFRTGVSFQNSVNAKLRFTRENTIKIALGQNRDNNPIPHSRQNIYNASLKADLKWGKFFTTDIGVSGSNRISRLTNFGASHARLFDAVLTDNLSQYPYRKLPDKSDTKELLTWLKTKYKKKKFETEATLSFNKQWDERKMGIINSALPPLLRNEELSDLNTGLSVKYALFNSGYRNHRLDFLANYSFNRNENDVERMNLQVFDGFRNSHEILYGAQYNYEVDNRIKILIDLNNKHYFSNTAQDYINLFPSVGVAIHLENPVKRLTRNWGSSYWHWLNRFKIFGNAGRSLGEASLIYRNYSVLTTEMTAADALSNFYENREIFSQIKKITPEIYENYEAGLEMGFERNRYLLKFTYFNNTTRNMIAPCNDAGQFFLQNIGDVRNDGFLLDVFLKPVRTRYIEFTINFNFSKMRNKVLNVADGQEKVALAGFSDVGTYFAKGEPLGVIYGTTYQRTANGAIVVDNNGVPLINTDLKRIGDPTPDFIIGFAPTLTLHGFTFSFNMEYNHGGDRWNGTKAFIENLPTKAAEDYIENASYLRLTQAFLSYKFPYKYMRRINLREINVGISGQNLFVVSPYKGTDPATNLFGYTTGRGLDFFNMPSVRNYQFFVNIKF